MTSTNSSPDTSKFTTSRQSFRTLISNLGIVVLVGFVLATLFTLWTPGEFTNQTNLQSLVFSPLPTPLPTSGPTPTARTTPLIGIVSGHWGHDPGSVCDDGLTEAEVNLTIATMVQKKFNDLGYDVEILKEFDPRLRNYQATVLVSIHNDSCTYINPQATGFKVAAAQASPDPIRATQLTSCLRSRYGQVTGLPLHSTSVTIDMTDYHAFDEIANDTTAAIIETGFLNLDRQFLTSQPDVVAQGIVDGILCFLHNETLATPSAAP